MMAVKIFCLPKKRCDRIVKDEKWKTSTPYGTIDITINLFKPEKKPRDIARAGQAKASGYPKCLLCKENEGMRDISHILQDKTTELYQHPLVGKILLTVFTICVL